MKNLSQEQTVLPLPEEDFFLKKTMETDQGLTDRMCKTSLRGGNAKTFHTLVNNNTHTL